MTVRAKFQVHEITNSIYGKSIKLRAVSDGSEENKAFFKATPSAECNIAIVNEEAAKQFEVGKSYYVDFTEAPPAS